MAVDALGRRGVGVPDDVGEVLAIAQARSLAIAAMAAPSIMYEPVERAEAVRNRKSTGRSALITTAMMSTATCQP